MDRRFEPRIECEDDVIVSWTDKDRNDARRQNAVLINISRSGTRLVTALRVPVGSNVTVHYPSGTFTGTVTHCLVRKPLHVIGVCFAPGCHWSKNDYWPKNARGLGKLLKSA